MNPVTNWELPVLRACSALICSRNVFSPVLSDTLVSMLSPPSIPFLMLDRQLFGTGHTVSFEECTFISHLQVMSRERFILLCLLPSTFLNLTFTFFWCALVVSGLPELIHAALLRHPLSDSAGLCVQEPVVIYKCNSAVAVSLNTQGCCQIFNCHFHLCN